MMMSLLDIAVKKSGETISTSDKTLVFAGSKLVGKSSMIQRFLEKNETVKETLALEYCFGRKSGRSLSKDVCHVWELGGGTLFSSLLPTVLGGLVYETTLILVLDLSEPQTLWITMETILETVYNHLMKSTVTELMKRAKERVPENHEDKNVITPFPIPLIIIGGKYDLFLSMGSEDKKLICRTLRLAAHSLAAHLFFYTEKDAFLVKKLKDILNNHGFGGNNWKGFNTDVNKPLLIHFGSDSFEQIGFNSSQLHSLGGLMLDRFKHSFTSHFPQESQNNSIPDDPAKDINFKEAMIDSIRVQKDEELDRILYEKQKQKALKKI